MSDTIPAINSYSAKHTHEPEIPPALDTDGRCLVCIILVRAEKSEAEVRRLRAELAAAQDALTRAHRNVDRMREKFSRIAPGEHIWSPPNETIQWSYCCQCGIIQRADGKNSPCKGPTTLRPDAAIAATKKVK